jgi:hypothetical protein
MKYLFVEIRDGNAEEPSGFSPIYNVNLLYAEREMNLTYIEFDTALGYCCQQ